MGESTYSASGGSGRVDAVVVIVVVVVEAVVADAVVVVVVRRVVVVSPDEVVGTGGTVVVDIESKSEEPSRICEISEPGSPVM